jgi:hypothetical protein
MDLRGRYPGLAGTASGGIGLGLLVAQPAWWPAPCIVSLLVSILMFVLALKIQHTREPTPASAMNAARRSPELEAQPMTRAKGISQSLAAWAVVSIPVAVVIFGALGPLTSPVWFSRGWAIEFYLLILALVAALCLGFATWLIPRARGRWSLVVTSALVCVVAPLYVLVMGVSADGSLISAVAEGRLTGWWVLSGISVSATLAGAGSAALTLACASRRWSQLGRGLP